MMHLEVWLYGPLAQYAGDRADHGHALLPLEMPDGTTVRALLDRLGVPLAEKGITFVNGQLTDMPGLEAGLDHLLKDGDRVAFFHRLSMWPFQYRHGANVSPALQKAFDEQPGGELHHSPSSIEKE